jgi:phage I-like protein
VVKKKEVYMARKQTSASDQDAVFVVNELGPQLPEWTLLIPWGRVAGESEMLVDEQSAEAVINRFKAHAADLVIDYEHQTLGGEYSRADGLAPAAGWVKEIRAEPGKGLFGRVDWTNKAKTAIAAREYRYLSPVAIKSKKAGNRVLRLHSAGLVNKPAIEGMCPIVNSEGLFDEENDMEELCKLLGLPPDASVEQCIEKIKALKGSETASVNSAAKLKIVAEEVGIADLDSQDLEVATNSLRTAFNRIKNPAGKVDAAELTKLNDEVKKLKDQLADRECDELISANSNRLPPAKTDWFRKTFRNDPAFAREWIKEAPELVVNKESAGGSESGEAVDRVMVINSARKEFAANHQLAALTSERNLVNNALRDKGLIVLTEEEVGKHGIKA